MLLNKIFENIKKFIKNCNNFNNHNYFLMSLILYLFLNKYISNGTFI